MMKVESVTIRTAKNGYTVEPTIPFDLGMMGSSKSGGADAANRREMNRPRVATSIEDALSQAADLLGKPCDVTPTDEGMDAETADDSVMTGNPSEMF